jgi:hypothetical protein
LIELQVGRELGYTGGVSPYAIFPTTAIVSLVCRTHEGGTAEICVVGNDGVIGIPLFECGNGAPSQPIVQSAGLAFRLEARLVTDEIHRGGAFLTILLRYGQVVLAQVAQTALCNRHHTIDQQVCRRLLLGLDRSTSDELSMTQAALASSLGVRREGVSAAAFKLRQAGIIRYSRGRIVVLDRQGLEDLACECYRAGRMQQERLLPAAMPWARFHPGVGVRGDRAGRAIAIGTAVALPPIA